MPKNDYGFNKKSITERTESYAEYFDIEDNQVIHIDDLKITLKNNNSHSIESFMIKIENSDFKVVYTSDIGTSNLDELVEFARNADLLICECSFILKHNSNCPTHFTAHQAGLLAKDSNCRELLLTHFWPLEDQNLYLEEALNVFNNSKLPEEGKELILKK
jgi:ribonuclease BN (tRNA processing enzyme)